MFRLILLTSAFLLLMIPLPRASAQDETVEFLKAEVITTFPHDTNAYTQGLLIHEGKFYESTGAQGGPGTSSLREVEIETGEVLRSVILDDPLYGEGLARVDDRLIQITWTDQKALVYDLASFEQVDTFEYEGQGWGICYDGRFLYMSDGTQSLSIRDAQTFELIFKGVVTFQGTPIGELRTREGQAFSRLNELECAGDYIYANIWQTDFIVKIDKLDGRIVALIDAAGLLSPEEVAPLGPEAVLNGIAYQPETDTFLLTGKYWPTIFEVRFVPIQQ